MLDGRCDFGTVPNRESTIDISPTLVDNHDNSKYVSLRTRQESLRVFFSPQIDTLQSGTSDALLKML
jgi:hypothetical protein